MESTAKVASGFIYYVSLKGVTGAGTLDVTDVANNVAKLREFTDLPINVGFGISDATSAQAVARVADGVVIGSKLITMIESGESIELWLREIRVALDAI